MENKPNYKLAFFVITSLFFMWGLITVLVDSLIPRLKEIFELSYFEAGLVQFAFFIAFFFVSIPAASLLNRIGYKKGIIVGLVVMGVGCLLFYPAAHFRVFELFMLGYFILASGMTVLQVAANPYVTLLGEERTASSRLNLSQAFNSLGTLIAPILGAILILSDSILSSEEINALTPADKELYFTQEASAVQLPFIILACSLIILGLIVRFVDLPELLKKSEKSSYKEALKDKQLRLGIIGIFLYVGAEVTIGSYLVNYFLDMNLPQVIRENEIMQNIAGTVLSGDLSAVDDKGVVGAFVVFYWGGAMIGRFFGSYFTKIYQPRNVLTVFALAAIACLIVTMLSSGLTAMWFILLVGLFNSTMFPTIFSLAINDLGVRKSEGAGLLVMAIAGGAFIPPMYGYLADEMGFKWAFVLLVICYAYILFFSRKAKLA